MLTDPRKSRSGPLRARESRPRLRIVVLVLAGLITLAPPTDAQTQPPPDQPLPPGPLELLVQRREALQLTPDQLGRLDAIRDELAVSTEPLVRRMMTLRTAWQQERRAARNGGRRPSASRIEQLRAAAEETRAQIQQNNRMAMQRVNRLLTPRQRATLRAILKERRQQNPGRRAGGSDADGSR